MRAFVIKTYPAKKISPRLGREPLGDLALEIVGGIFAKNGYKTTQLKVQVLSREPLITDLDLTRLQPVKGDIFSFSCHIGNIIESTLLAEYLGKECPESTLLMGGPHFNKFVVETILKDHPYINYVLTGLAENNLTPFLEALNDRKFDKVGGLYYLEDGELKSNSIEYSFLRGERSR